MTRFYGLHVGFLPVLLVLCLVAHVALFRRHGITTPAGSETRPTATFWPEQFFMDTVASALVLGVVIVLVLAEGGANLDAPADPASSDYPARPEWYFLSLFQMLKLFPGSREIIGTIVIPTALVVVMMLLPFLDRILPRKLAHFLACGLVFAVVGAACYLTGQAMIDDGRDALFQQGRKNADEARQRHSTWPDCRKWASRQTARHTYCAGTRSLRAAAFSTGVVWAVTSLKAKALAHRPRLTSRTLARGNGFAACWRTRSRRRTSARRNSAA